MREIEFKVLSDGKIFGIERLINNEWQWMCYELNPDKGERWILGVLRPNVKLIRRQFSGHLDIENKKIYEGDMVDTHPFHKLQGNCRGKKRFQKVVFQNGSFMAEYYDFGWEGEGVIQLSQCKATSNIFSK